MNKGNTIRKPNQKNLNLGCGEFPKPGFYNVNAYAQTEPDLRHDLNTFPYPFPDKWFERVVVDHVLEHLDRPFQVMKELNRITKPGGHIEIRVPHFSRGFTHPEHARGFDVSFPLYFQSDFPGGYQGFPLTLEVMRLRWLGQPYLKQQVLLAPVFRLAGVAGRLLDILANLHPMACSRLWCFWVGGFEEIEFVFKLPDTTR